MATKIAITRVLPKGGWTLNTINKLGVLALSKKVILGVNLHTVKYLIYCVFDKYSKPAGIKYCQSWLLV